MCGVIGYIGSGATPEFFYNGLKRLEYRGYDSAGISVLDDGLLAPITIRAEGKLSELHKQLHQLPSRTHIGIGHTRWATHGKPSVENAHPHQSGPFVLLHNGIIENYKALKTMLVQHGYEFKSETDTEVVVHLLDHEFHKVLRVKSTSSVRPLYDSIFMDPELTAQESIPRYESHVKEAILSVVSQIRGAFALAILCTHTPGTLYAVKFGSPLIIGQGEGENYIASGITALIDHTKKMIVLEDKEMAIIKKDSIEICTFDNVPQTRASVTIDWSSDLMEKNGFDHFMLKEIHESSKAVSQTLVNRVNRDTGRINLEAYGISKLNLKKVNKVQIIACGSSYYSGLLGKMYIERFTKIPVEVDIASEYRYRTSTANEHTLAIAISQSGETIDTLQAIRHASAQNALTLALVNMPQSTIAHHCQAESLIYAGPEVGVASTKAFSAQVCSLFVCALALAQERGRSESINMNFMSANSMNSDSIDSDLNPVDILIKTSTLMDSVLQSSQYIRKISEKFTEAKSVLYTGRGLQWPIAMEGALKLKEISYIHAEGYPSGELKHGPIALIDKNMIVVCLCPKDSLYEKNVSNIEEIKARGGKVLIIGTEGDSELKSLADDFIGIPEASELIQPFLTACVVHLLAYWIAVQRGHNIDQPRNLAKSVTVE